MRWLIVLIALLPCSAAELASRLDALLNGQDAKQMGWAGISVVDAANGNVLYEKNADRLLLPASNMKLLTAALAFERLGPEYKFTTRVILDHDGNLVLIGSGDPTLSSRMYPYANGNSRMKRGAMEELADQVVSAGIRKVSGDIIGDDRLFPWEPSPPSWTVDDGEHGYGAPVSALSFNDNVVEVVVTPGKRAGDLANIQPAVEYLTTQDVVITGPANSQAVLTVKRVPGSDQWVFEGSLPSGSGAVRLELPVTDPAHYAASALREALLQRGVSIVGQPRALHRRLDEGYSAPDGRETASRVSPPLGEVLETALKVSQNLHAELLLREAGRVTKGAGTNQTGLEALGAFLRDRGSEGNEWRAEDGSGLARNDLVTPRLITKILEQEYQAHGEPWSSLLPAGGSEGTLEHRLCCISEGRGLWAKTGTLNRAVALSGYAKTPEGLRAFSILVNNFAAPTRDVQKWIDKIAVALLE